MDTDGSRMKNFFFFEHEKLRIVLHGNTDVNRGGVVVGIEIRF
jgi:hypothetical protein